MSTAQPQCTPTEDSLQRPPEKLIRCKLELALLTQLPGHYCGVSLGSAACLPLPARLRLRLISTAGTAQARTRHRASPPSLSNQTSASHGASHRRVCSWCVMPEDECVEKSAAGEAADELKEDTEEAPHFLHHVDSCKVFASEKYVQQHLPHQQQLPSPLSLKGGGAESVGEEEQSPPVNTGHLQHQDSVQLTRKHLRERSPNPDKPLKFKVGEQQSSPQGSDGADSGGEQHIRHVDSAVLIRKHPPHHRPSRLGATKFQLAHPGLVRARGNSDGEDSEDVEEGDNADSEATPSQGNAMEAVKPMSKTQQKKLAKKQRLAEIKAEKKAAVKADKAAQMEVRKAEKDTKMASMSEEERTAYFEALQAKKAERRAEQEARKDKLKAAMESGQRLVIDLDFEDKMNETEIRSLCQQLSYSYSANCRSGKPFHLHLSSLKGHIESTLRHQAAGMENWYISKNAACYEETFTEEKDKIVYLTADSPNTLSELDPSKIYVIGGIVDRNRHKSICFERAKAAGVATAALPIGPHLKLAGSKVLTVNQVVEIMLQYVDCKDWKAALLKVIPERKRDAENDDAEAGAVTKRHKA